MMSIQPDTIHEPVTGEATIEGIDLDADVQCSAKGHDHSADIIIAGHCPGCDWRPVAARCWDWWQQRGRMRCPKCDTRGARDDMAWIVEVLR